MKVKQALEKTLHELQLEYLDLYLVSDITTHSECSSFASSCNIDNFANLLFRAALWCCCYIDGMFIIYLYNKKHGVCLCFWAVRTYLQTFLLMPPFKPTYIDLHFTLVDSMSSMLLMLRSLMRFQLKRVWVTMNPRTRIPQSGRSSRKGGRIQCQIPQSWRSSTKGGRIQCWVPQSWRSTRREEFKVESKVESLNCDRAQGRKNSILLFCGTKECHL